MPPKVAHIGGGEVGSSTSHPIDLSGSAAVGSSIFGMLVYGIAANNFIDLDGVSGLQSTTTGLYRSYVFAKVATGNDAITFITSSAAPSAHVVYEINGWASGFGLFGGGTLVGTSQTQVTANPNPGVCAPNWGAIPSLFVSLGLAATPVDVNAYPDPDNQASIVSPTTFNAYGCTRESAAQSVDVGAFTLSASASSRVMTIAVRGLAQGPVVVAAAGDDA